MTQDEIRYLLSADVTAGEIARLHRMARDLTDQVFGREVYIRALIEITNECRNDCLYCGIRRSCREIKRYTLTLRQIEECCKRAYDAGMRTFVLQGGENPSLTARDVAEIVSRIRSRWPGCAVTLSLGEWPDNDLALFREAGADRYLLRHETRDRYHYSRLHPPSMSLANRLRCLVTLKRLGYQTGTGIMVGSPWQTTEHILRDISMMLTLQPEMIGIGPFIPAAGTPFEGFAPGNVGMTLRLISIFRLLFPKALIPATTALATLGGGDGRVAGLMAGANVVMPNVSPVSVRESYRLYDNKSSSGSESIEGIGSLDASLRKAGLRISYSRGDAPVQ